jgi:hypothetical protein
MARYLIKHTDNFIIILYHNKFAIVYHTSVDAPFLYSQESTE